MISLHRLFGRAAFSGSENVSGSNNDTIKVGTGFRILNYKSLHVHHLSSVRGEERVANLRRARVVLDYD